MFYIFIELHKDISICRIDLSVIIRVYSFQSIDQAGAADVIEVKTVLPGNLEVGFCLRMNFS